MTNDFRAEYEAYVEIKEMYNAAWAAGDEEQLRYARVLMKSSNASIQAKGDDYFRMFSRYRDAKECGNEYIDLHDAIWDNQVEPVIEAFRKFGIDHFTFSSTWSSAVKTAWLFKENGCELEGLVLINSEHKEFMSDEYEKVPAYLFKVN